MSARRLVEEDVNLIIKCIKTNIASALSDTRIDRGDKAVTTEPPYANSYFIYEGAKGYKTPAIFVISDEIDFKKQEWGANFIDAIVKVKVSVVVEDRSKQNLTIKSWRYQAALHEILDQTPLTSTDNKVKLDVVVTRASFSPLFSTAKDTESPEAVFRKEIELECDVYHRENF